MTGMLVSKGDVVDFSRAKSYRGIKQDPEKLRMQRGMSQMSDYDRAAWAKLTKPRSKLPGRLWTGAVVAGTGALIVDDIARSHRDRKKRAAALQRRREQRIASRTTRGAGAVGKRYDGPDVVIKRLVDEEHHVSIPRALATGAGMGAIAWGGSRFKVLGRGLRLGATHPDIKDGLRRAFHTAELARSSTERITSPLGAAAGRGYGHLPANVRASLDNVPPSLRPATSALVGAIVVENSRPVRRTTYRPVVID